jgi:glycosyltransferase involved in cell wall biosynthesis
MRLLFIRWHPSPRVGGLAVNTEQLMEQFARRGHVVGELTAMFPALVRPVVEASVRRFAARIPAGYRRDGVVGRFRAIVPEAAAPAVLRSFAPDAVIVSSGGAWRTAWAQRMLDTVRRWPTVLYVYDVASSDLPAAGAGVAPTVVAISQWVAAPLRERGVHVEVIVPVIERARYRVATTRETALLINPTASKGVDMALALAAARPDIPFEFIGGPPGRGRPGHAPANVSHRGWTHDPRECFGRARLLLVPSRYPEAWPRVVGEAQASGIPALATDIGGMCEAVGNGGRLLPAGAGAPEWEGALASIWDNERSYTEVASRAEREGSRPELSPEAAASRLEAAVANARSRWRQEQY